MTTLPHALAVGTAVFVAALLIDRALRAIGRAIASRWQARLDDPTPTAAERDIYFNREYARPPADPDEPALRAWYSNVRVLDLSKFSPAPCARSDRWCLGPSIVGRTVVSEPGAAIRVEVLHLSPEMRARLDIGNARLPGARA